MPGPFSTSTPLIQPIGQFVTVQLLPEEPVSPLAVGVPRIADATQQAIILALGQGLHDLTVGARVLCRPQQGQVIGDEGQMLLPSTAILATVEPDDTPCANCAKPVPVGKMCEDCFPILDEEQR